MSIIKGSLWAISLQVVGRLKYRNVMPRLIKALGRDSHPCVKFTQIFKRTQNVLNS